MIIDHYVKKINDFLLTRCLCYNIFFNYLIINFTFYKNKLWVTLFNLWVKVTQCFRHSNGIYRGLTETNVLHYLQNRNTIIFKNSYTNVIQYPWGGDGGRVEKFNFYARLNYSVSIEHSCSASQNILQNIPWFQGYSYSRLVIVLIGGFPIKTKIRFIIIPYIYNYDINNL